METSTFNSLILSLASLVLYYVLRILYVYWLKPKRVEKIFRNQGIKGISYSPFYSDLKDMAKYALEARSKPINLDHRIVPRVLPFFCQMVEKHGRICMSWTGTKPRLIVVDPEIMKLILNDKDGHFIKPPSPNPLVDLLQLGLSTLEGEKWAKRRKFITPAFHFEKLKEMVLGFSISCCNLITRWEKLVCLEGSCELDVAAEFQVLTGDIISRVAFGSSYEEGKKIFEQQKEQVHLALEAYFGFYFPGFRFLPTKKNKRRYYLDKQIKSTLRGMIAKKQKAVEKGEPDSNDLLGLLLQLVGAENDIKIEDVIEECKLFYFAGQETTANLLTWTMVLLSMHLEWQEKAREEVLQICGNRTPDPEDIARLKTVSMILNEVLRLYPPVTLLYRYTTQNTAVGNISIPAGVETVLPTLMLQHDPDYWGDEAESFRPERFAEGVSKASKNQMSFYTFGWGPRICLGQSFATLEAKMALAMILQHFRFQLSPSYVHAPCTVITLQPQHGAKIMLRQL